MLHKIFLGSKFEFIHNWGTKRVIIPNLLKFINNLVDQILFIVILVDLINLIQ